MSTYTFKRGVVRRPESWTISAEGISSSENQSTMSWGELQEAQFSDAPAGSGGLNVLELILKSDTEKLALQCNDRRGGESREWIDRILAIG